MRRGSQRAREADGLRDEQCLADPAQQHVACHHLPPHKLPECPTASLGFRQSCLLYARQSQHRSPGHSSLGVRTSPATGNHKYTLFNQVKQKAFSTTLMLLHNCFVLPKLKLVFLTFLPSPVHCPPMHQPTFNCLFRMTCSMSPMLSVTWPQARPSAAQSSSAGLCLLLETRRKEAHPGRSTWGETG